MPYQARTTRATALCLTFYSLFFLTSCKQVDNKENVGVQTLDVTVFNTQVNPIFDLNIGGKPCASAGCHLINQGSGGSFQVFANAAGDSVKLLTNYTSATKLSNLVNPSQSKLLLEPLTGIFSSVGSHAGGDIFVLNDANYTIIFNWINSPVAPP
jgi:hypothetical protein